LRQNLNVIFTNEFLTNWYSEVMRRYLIAVFLLVGVSVALAQLFNLDDEDRVGGLIKKSANGAAAPTQSSGETIKIEAVNIPTGSEAADIALDNAYQKVVSALKMNDVPLAMKITADYDVITKQKIVYRLMKENPADFRAPAAAPTETPDAVDEPQTDVEPDSAE
jgi:hypothetical protein